MLRLILASQSPHRLNLLRNAGYEVEVVSTGVAEPSLADFPELDVGLVHIAALKARAAWRLGGRGLIFAADTVGHSGPEVLGKPVDRQDAIRMLKAISGTVHEVLTGWCLFRTHDELQISGVEKTSITMRVWRDDELESYLDSGEWVGKSGAYGLRLPHDPFVTNISGSASSVVGVPLERLEEILAEFKL